MKLPATFRCVHHRDEDSEPATPPGSPRCVPATCRSSTGSRPLDASILRGWKSSGKGTKRFTTEILVREPAYRWKRTRVMGHGVKLGTGFCPAPSGDPVYQAGTLAPSGGIDAESMGMWDGDADRVGTARVYSWKHVGEPKNTYAIRNIGTQAVFAPHQQDAYLTNQPTSCG